MLRRSVARQLGEAAEIDLLHRLRGVAQGHRVSRMTLPDVTGERRTPLRYRET